jgi:hypothetical protein
MASQLAARQPVLLDFDQRMKQPANIHYALGAAYFCLALTGILHHELWLDEAHHWLLSRDSGSFAGLWANTRYEGHPILWNFLLFLISRFSWNPLWMQVLHVCIATAAAVVFLRKAPLGLPVKVLFIFGYFMIFEYALISRNYMLGVLFLFLACSVYRQKSGLWFYVWLGMAFQAHMVFGVPALAFFGMDVLERLRSKSLKNQQFIAGCCVFFALFALGAWQMIPPADSIFFDPIQKLPVTERLIKGFAFPFKGWLAAPDFRTIHFWNSNLLVDLSKTVSAVLALAAFALPLALFRSRKALVFTYLALMGGQFFFFITQRGAARFDGMALIVLIIGLWIEKLENPISRRLLQKPLVYGILALQLITGAIAWTTDFRQPFTGSEESAAWLAGHNLQTMPLVGVSCDVTAISAYLPKKIWFLCENRYGSFCHWDQLPCGYNLKSHQIREMLTGYLLTTPKAVFVSGYKLGGSPEGIWETRDGVSMRLLHRTGETVVRNSGYYIYEIKRP